MMNKKLLIKVIILVLFVGVAMFGISKTITKKGQTQKKQIDYTYNHKNCGQWYTNERAFRSDVYPENGICLVNEMKLFYYDTNSNDMFPICQKKGCVHADLTCISKHSWSYINYHDGEYFACDSSDYYSIVRIRNSEAEVFYRSEEPIRNIWCYNEYIYFTTDSQLLRIALDDKNEKIILNRPIFLYLFFQNDKIIYEDDSMKIFEADLDGSNEHILLDDKVNMIELDDHYIYYRNGKDFNVYRMNEQGNQELIIKDNCYRYLLTEEGIFYISDYNDETGGNLKLLDLNNKTTTLRENIFDFSYVDESGMFLDLGRELTKEEKQGVETSNCYTALYYWNREKNEDYFIQDNVSSESID